MKTPKVLKLVEEGLKRGGYDGLFNELGDCACLIGGLAPCYDGFSMGCQAGWKQKCNDKCGHESDWHVVAAKPRTKCQN